MFLKEDNTYREIKEKSVKQWLEEMSRHEDIAVRGGVKATREYLESLKKQIADLEEKNALKNKYLKQLAEKNRK